MLTTIVKNKTTQYRDKQLTYLIVCNTSTSTYNSCELAWTGHVSGCRSHECSDTLASKNCTIGPDLVDAFPGVILVVPGSPTNLQEESNVRTLRASPDVWQLVPLALKHYVCASQNSFNNN